MTEIIVALIIGGLSLIGVILTNASSNKNVERKIEIAQAVTDIELKELTREVREHNNFAKRVPILEEQIAGINRWRDSLEH